MKNTGEIIIYKTGDKQTQIEVKFEKETVWLSQKQMSELFGIEVPAISKHVKNIFDTGELSKATLSKMETVQKEGEREIKRSIDHFSLDMIISVGYRVNSKQGIQFRIWANKILKEYLIKGYAVNEKRLKETQQNFIDLKKTVKLLENVIEQKALSSDEATGLLKIITDYTHALDLLDQYDHQTLKKSLKTSKEKFKITYDEAINAIKTLKEKFGGSELFGNEKDESLKSSLGNIYQTYQKKELYPVQKIKLHIFFTLLQRIIRLQTVIKE